ncbi:MAG TPA: dihydroorotate dehydrogenase [Bacteroidales bacterium]|jgi:dihydroorotate dehydrogenase (NAD+) catalytic subunit|nr:dihydroorotate dehydrogenase [Bacteroidales bacterium]HHU98964.1 dihydroorotate dehydrogenase [Bacteroidales bacterium]HOR10617.1 dihydroorotate dehydrogenase [Bacteroidales bacterium]
MADLRIKIGPLELRNPVILASGTCGYGSELEDFIDISELGGIIVKGTTLEQREGNPYPRMAETASGMLNAVGLQNKGIDHFEKNIYPHLAEYKTHVIVNINGNTIEDYVELSRRINSFSAIPAIELNISCPNVKQGGMVFGTNPASARKVISAVRRVYDKTLIVKLSPNVTDITEFARISQEEGAEAVSLVNTFLGMAVDISNMRPKLSTITGGLSGPAIKPVALRMVWQAARAVTIPVIGLGGIMNAEDALEFIMAGATAVQVGTASFINPRAGTEIVAGIEKFLVEKEIDSVSTITGIINRK